MKQVRECCMTASNVVEFCRVAKEHGATDVVVLRKLPESFSAPEGLTVRDVSPARFADVATQDLRKAVESSRLDLVIGIEDYFLKQKGKVNQVICNLLADRNTAVIFSTSRLLALHGAQRARLLKHISDCITLFKKYKVGYYFCAVSDEVTTIRGREEKEALIRIL